MNNLEIKSLINKRNVITFDVFDTLIKRNIDNKDFFYFLESEYNNRYRCKKNLAKDRLKAEKMARKKCAYREVNIDEIYEHFRKGYNAEEIKRIKDLEVELELLVCVANQSAKELYDYAVSIGKKIFIISDMYLSSKQIDLILKKNGYTHHEKVYSSCDERLTKWEQGLLFKKFMDRENLVPDNILHIGNDQVADYSMPQIQGVKAALIDEERVYPRYYGLSYLRKKDYFIYSWLSHFIVNTLPDNENNIFKLGYEVFGPLLLGFTQWLSREIDRADIKKVFFFSRDGYILKKAFDIWRPDIRTDYLYISRKSIIRPILQYDNSFEEFLSHYKSWDKRFSLDYFLKRYEINVPSTLLERFDLSLIDKFDFKSLRSDKRILALYDKLKKFIIDDSIKQATYSKQYYKESDFEGKVAVIDLGAGCSIEFALNEFIEKESLDIYPSYFYIHSPLHETNVRRLFFDSSKRNPLYNSLLRFSYMFLEIFMAAPHGSVKGYNLINSKIIPELSNFEYCHDGKVDELNYISELQRGALEFLKRATSRFGNTIITPEASLQNFKNFAISPEYEDIKAWKDYRVDLDKLTPLIMDDIGSGLFNKIKNIKEIKNVPWLSGYIVKSLRSRWTMKRIFDLYYCYTCVNNLFKRK